MNKARHNSKSAIVAIFASLIIGLLSSCGVNRDKQNNLDCPDSTEYFSKIEAIKSYHEYSDSLGLNGKVKFESLQHSFALALDYLYEVTGLPSQVQTGNVYGYIAEEDYQNDVRQYSEWYETHCK